ncbi:MAG TPA: Rho termination factor N-terminal domain-containing protein [Candidatus Polarisedimenticolaceae bacterium]|nr:Rho termination factor N-terminal domain-containing protein [Candidatus Polarisedimenticolaceae bacterium]
MPSWSSKDRRQYEHIKESAKKRGKSTRRAKEIAGRTVNKSRRRSGRTPNKTTQGTGNPTTSLQERKVSELRNLASRLEIEGRSRMKKDQLVRAIQRAR